MARYVCIIFILYIVYASVTQVWSCTAFSFSKDGETFVARNYDWRVADGLVVKNPRGLKKVAYVSGNGQQSKQAHWISRFGSVSFNQYGREFPAGGMNETGLVVEGLLVKEASYPAYAQRGVVQQCSGFNTCWTAMAVCLRCWRQLTRNGSPQKLRRSHGTYSWSTPRATVP